MDELRMRSGHVGPGFSKSGLLRRFHLWLGPAPAAQLAILLACGALLWYFGINIVATMRRLGIEPGFAFLSQRANFEIGESLIAYSSSDSYGRALLAGLVNTIYVALAGCILSTTLGSALGIAQLSRNLVLTSAVRSYVEIFRNTPLLLQLFLWSAIFHTLPAARNATEIAGAFLSNRGVYIPRLVLTGSAPAGSLVLSLSCGLIIVIALRRLLLGRPFYATQITLAAIISMSAVFWLTGGGIDLDLPTKGGFNISGGLSLSPEFAGLLVGLVFNSAATIAEIVRGGIQSVQNGQWEAARSLGLRPGHIMRLIVLPQALRVITPLMTSSYLDLTKNSSLAVAIGFPDLVNVANTTANTTGQTLEAIAIIAGAYLSLNLVVSLAMNFFNNRIVETGSRR
ncbi:ABC transporter permease subunit [Agrobacterium rhizogenes]|uniref:amino acid ABC transporter permease n=1 Tax=Rhizobium rhizogenes TaxID=359 RepID=UPI0015726B14|nr:ABC transporter permease subunit [Rhizobium rhizogenes]NTF52919.1 ABC transporter permease subunit [Rhizobium rhizogenes]NTH10129.1 ABC transporter permease subunit [Rhizobium rhizogenes]NTH42681.1 ABC transporter permease subunit [Rhizobium rhizogenes]NTI06688.1 ABC transporter permease subunit [Rhizobium rhizogenes]NTI13493.1 ABC transporter permease subunit [Rhizobium rhizogenes]